MNETKSMEFVVRCVDEEIFASDAGPLTSPKDTIPLPQDVQVAITEKMTPLDPGLYIFLGMVATFAVGVGSNVLANLISDWIKERLQKWGKRKPSTGSERPVVICVIGTTVIEFWIVKNDVEIRQSRQ